MATILTARQLCKSFGSNCALRDVDFDVSEGRIMGLAGANGAGKSTLLRILSGNIQPDEGDIFVDGELAKLTSPASAIRRGIALVAQELTLFPALSIRENMTLSPYGTSTKPVSTQALASTLGQLGLDVSPSSRLSRLSLADRQLVEIGRALLREPRVLILDEPTSALRSVEKQRLHKLLTLLKNMGVGIVYVSHFLEDLLSIADDLVILRDGTRVRHDIQPHVAAIPQVVDTMLGRKTHRATQVAQGAAGGDETRSLTISGLRGPVRLRINDLRISSSSGVVGLAGLAGAGVHELFAVLFGRLSPMEGEIRLPDGSGCPRSIYDAVKHGVAFVPSDRKKVGLMLSRSIRDNAGSVRSLTLRRDGMFLRLGPIARAVEKRCASIGVKMSSTGQNAGELSGGNQQKVVFAKWLEIDPSLLLLDDPTRGIDIGAKQEMHLIIRRLAAEGKVVLMYSSDPRELVEACDRVLVFVDGSITTEFVKGAFGEHELTTAMNGPNSRAA